MHSSKAFTLIELMIVVSILGIMAAIVLPELQGHTQKAKEATAKDSLRTIRSIIEHYKLDHNGVTPGYLNGSPIVASLIYFQLTNYTNSIGDSTGTKTGAYIYGPYLNEMPKNPFNDDSTFALVGDAESFPSPATGTTGWYYKPLTGEIRLNWDGTDSEGNAYASY